ncbi:MAG: thiamine diphosphokinase [Candidatus Thermoplasmatota archaeon]|nr:thiamine diphosphokinase [Candidatus Thermoplasmatota archaeon]
MAVVKFRALLIAAGDADSLILQNLVSEKNLCVAIDGGYHHCIKYEIIPDVAIGDFDSFNKSLIDERVDIIEIKSQNETDLVKAINWVISKGIKEIQIIGVESGRSDHILGVYAALSELNQEDMGDVEIEIHLNDFIVKYIPNNKPMKFSLNENTHVSLFCLSSSIVTLKGVKWTLDKEELNFSTRGIHNYSIKEEVEIKIHAGGPALFFINR